MKTKAFIFLCSISVIPCDLPNEIKEEEDTEIFLNKRCDPPCIFSEYYLTLETVDGFPKNCTTVCSDLRIDKKCDLTENQLAATFKNMKNLIGSLLIEETKYKSGTFLTGLETVECGSSDRVQKDINGFDKSFEKIPQFEWDINYEMLELGLTNLTRISCGFNKITTNVNLTRLNIPNLKSISYPSGNGKKMYVILDGVGYNFCITSGELLSFIKTSELQIDMSKVKYCEPPSTVETGKICNSTSITDGCTQIFGSLVIGPENEHLVHQLNTVEVIFGGLVVNNTNLTNIDFLESLKYIYHLDDKSAVIQIENNPNLSNFSFPSLVVAQTLANTKILFSNNNEIRTSDSTYCDRLKNMLNITDPRQIFFDGKYCGLQFNLEKKNLI
eukprot:NP_506931.2 Insulin/EGF-Receptor L Domain protein [Caenorhabditis elegans]